MWDSGRRKIPFPVERHDHLCESIRTKTNSVARGKSRRFGISNKKTLHKTHSGQILIAAIPTLRVKAKTGRFRRQPQQLEQSAIQVTPEEMLTTRRSSFQTAFRPIKDDALHLPHAEVCFMQIGLQAVSLSLAPIIKFALRYSRPYYIRVVAFSAKETKVDPHYWLVCLRLGLDQELVLTCK